MVEEPRLDGFRTPQDEITRSCLYYMGRIMELREFTGFYFDFVKTSHFFRDFLKEKEEEGPELVGKPSRVVNYNFSVHRQLVNELMLSRAVESFDLYVLNILREIFTVEPKLLKSDSKVDAATLIELRTPEEIIYYLSERQLNELGYKPLSQLREWIEKKTGLDLFRSEETFETVLFATEIRNLIAHNDCQANDTMRKRLGDRSEKLDISDHGKVNVSDDFLRSTCYTLDGIVFDFDAAVCKKFEVHTANRFGTFFIRE